MSLQRIFLKDFAIVELIELDFESGFTALTGETGAGKSILIDALQLALGGRADASMVRDGQTRAEVAVDFLGTTSTRDWLDQQGIDAESDTLLLRRTVDNVGRSRGWVNGVPVTATQLRELGGMLVDIHGQHAWQGLTRQETALALLDEYAGVATDALPALWTAWKEAQRALTNAVDQQATMALELEQVNWQLAELEKLAPNKSEWEALQQEHRRLANVSALTEAAQLATEWLSGGSGDVTTHLAKAMSALNQRLDVEPQFGPCVRSLEEALVLAQDVNRDLNTYLRRTEADPERLQQLDQRMGTWTGLAKRHRCLPEELHGLTVTLREKRDRLGAATDLEKLQDLEAASAREYMQKAHAISAQRRAKAPLLSDSITAVMQRLGMEGGVFEVQLVEHAAPTLHGLEGVEFLVAGHAGTVPKPVLKVASGGELSRIALAISVTTSQLGGAPTLIFDEVDSGVGGSVATTVGTLMRELGHSRQVLAVTHLAQVASCADHHLKVEKNMGASGVHSAVIALREGDRIQEIARMLGGAAITDASVAHAREMLNT